MKNKKKRGREGKGERKGRNKEDSYIGKVRYGVDFKPIE